MAYLTGSQHGFLRIARTCKEFQSRIVLRDLDGAEVYTDDYWDGRQLNLCKAFVRAHARVETIKLVTSLSEAPILLAWLFEGVDRRFLRTLHLEDAASFMPVCTPPNWPLGIDEYGRGKEMIVARKALKPYDPPASPRPTAEMISSLSETLTELALDVDLVYGRFFTPVSALSRLRKLTLIFPFDVASIGHRRAGRGSEFGVPTAFTLLSSIISDLDVLEVFKLTRCAPENRRTGPFGFITQLTPLPLAFASESLRTVDLREADLIRLYAECPNLVDLYVKDGRHGSGVRRCGQDGKLIDDEEGRHRGGSIYLQKRLGINVSAAHHDWFPLPASTFFPSAFMPRDHSKKVPLPDACTVHFCP